MIYKRLVYRNFLQMEICNFEAKNDRLHFIFLSFYVSETPELNLLYIAKNQVKISENNFQ